MTLTDAQKAQSDYTRTVLTKCGEIPKDLDTDFEMLRWYDRFVSLLSMLFDKLAFEVMATTKPSCARYSNNMLTIVVRCVLILGKS
jgi:hypothetical protein